MAYTIPNSAFSGARLERGIPSLLGTLGAANQAVAFTLPTIQYPSLRRLALSVSGTLSGGTYVLEVSQDGGASWYALATSDTNLSTTSVPDTAGVTALRYDVSGLSGCLFRFGTTAYTSGTGTVYGTVD